MTHLPRKGHPPGWRRSLLAVATLCCVAAIGLASLPPAFEAPVPAGFDQVVALATDKIDVDKDVTIVAGSLVGNNSGSEIELKDGTATAVGYSVTSDTLKIEDGVDTNGSFFCDDLDDDTGSVSCGSVSFPVFTALPPFLSASAGSSDIELDENQTQTLGPQAIGKLELKKKAKLYLTGGVYDIEELKAEERAKIYFQGPTILRVEKKVELEKKVKFEPDPDDVTGLTGADIRVYVDDDVQIKEQATVRASFYAPGDKIELEKKVSFAGAMLAKEIQIKEEASLTVESAFRNLAPVAVDDGFTVAEGASANTLAGGATSLLANDSDPNNDGLTASSAPVSGPSNGAVVLAADGTFTYTHNGSETTVDSFLYEVCDDGVAPGPLCSTATVAITITPVNDAPVPTADSFTVDEAGTTTLLDGGASSLLANDTDAEGNALTASLFTGPSNGSVSINGDGTFSYTHNGSETTSDSFVYEVCDNGGDPPGPLCALGNVSVTVNPINDAPVAGDDTFTVDEGGSASSLDGGALSVLANDSDDDDVTAVLSAVLVAGSGPSNGTLTLNPDGTFSYVHDGSESLADSFQYEVCDDGTDPPGQLCDTGDVAITVNPVNDAPIATDDTFTVDEGATASILDGGASSVLDNDTDAENDGLTVALFGGGPANGTLTLDPDGTFSYTHDGSETLADSFAYQVCDDGSPVECDTATVAVTVNPVNDDPTADDQTLTVGFPVTITLTGSDPENDPLTFSIATAPSQGSLGAVTGTGPTSATVDYTPPVTPDGDAVADSFAFLVDDGNGGNATGLVSITVVGTNSPPVTQQDAIRLTIGSTATSLVNGATSLLANDFDPDSGDTLTLQPLAASGPSQGTVTLNANGTFAYTHTGTTAGVDTFVYTVCDDGSPSLCSNGQVNVQVLAGSIDITLTFLGDGDGSVTSSPGGLSCIDDCMATVASLDRVSLTAMPASGSAFGGFGGDADCADGNLLADVAKNCTVTFNAVAPPPTGFFNLTVSKTGSGGGTVTTSPAGIDCGVNCAGVFPAFDRIVLIPIADPGSEFVSWSGTEDCLDGDLIRLPGEDASCVAVFDAIVVPPSVETLTVVVQGQGSVNSSPGGLSCSSDATCAADFAAGSVVTLGARPSTGSFVGWSGACFGTSPLVSVTLDAAKTCTAIFSN